MSNLGTRAPPRKLLERGSTFDSSFYIVGQLTTRPTELLGSIFLLHRRAANDEADRVVGIDFFISDLAIEQSAPPAGPDVVAILCVMKRLSETRSEQL